MKKVWSFLKEMVKSNKKLIIICMAIVVCITGGIFCYKQLTNNKFKVVDVIPTKFEKGVTANDSTFIIKTENGSLKKVKEHIYLYPAVDYDIKQRSKNKYELTINSELDDNSLFNVEYVENEVAEYKWAFQTKKDLSVNSIYPADGASYVDKNSVVELFFSYPEVENVEDYFEISPHVDGTFKSDGRRYIFTPDTPFAEDETYTVTIKPGLKVGDVEMIEEFTSTFSTRTNTSTNNDKITNSYISVDSINTFTPNEVPVLIINDPSNISNTISTIEIYKIDNADKYINYLQTGDSELTYYKNDSFVVNNIDSYDYQKTTVTMSNTLPEGYYVLYLKNSAGNIMLKTNVQVNKYSAYSLVTEKDVLVWVAEDGQTKENIAIKAADKSGNTNKDGYYIFKNISDNSKKLSYLKIGDGTSLIVGYVNYDNPTLGNAYLYTDRPIYKSDDIVKIWGYIPKNHFSEKIDFDKVSLYFQDELVNAKINSDGTFITSFDLKKYTPKNYVNIYLKYNNQNIGSTYVTVENYTTLNYIYSIDLGKDYLVYGEELNVKVDVKHITGLAAVSKDIVVNYDGKEYYGTTDNLGEFILTLPTSKITNSVIDYISSSNSIEVKSSGVDYNKYSTREYLMFYKSDVDINIKNQNEKLIYNVNKLDFNNPIVPNSYTEGFNKTPYNGNATLYIYEVVYTRNKTGERYDSYYKKTVPVYSYNSYEKIIDTKVINVENGVFEYEYDKNYTPSTENSYSSYYAKLVVKDDNNNDVTSKAYYHYGSYSDSSSQYYNYENQINSIYNGNATVYSGIPLSDDYNFYRYAMKTENASNYFYFGSKEKYSIGDNVPLKLYDYLSNVSNEGRVLQISYQNNIINTNIVTDDELDMSFNKEMYPGANITGAYLVNNRFYRLPSYYYDYNEKDSQLEVNISTGKETYEPGEKVTGKIEIKDKDGNPMNGKVNISVVNEKVFNISHASSNFLSTIFRDEYYSAYSYSSYRDIELMNTLPGGAGATTAGRSNFGDTVYFDMLTVKNGTVDFNFKLNDDITKYRITVHTVAEKDDIVYAGVGEKLITSTLPLSISSIIPYNIKNTDDFVINATPIVGDNVKVTISVDGIDDKQEFTTSANQTVYANFGKLSLGKHTVHISATDGVNNDAMKYDVDVVETTQEVFIKKTENIQKSINIKPTKNPIIIEVYNNKLTKYLTYINHIKTNYTSRLDTQIAYYKALELEGKYYETGNSIVNLDLSSYYENGKLKLLENASGDYILTGLASYYASDYVNIDAYNYELTRDDYSNKDLLVKKLFVKAAMREPVLMELDLIDPKLLNVENKLLLGLSYAFVGDYQNAYKVYKQIKKKQCTDLLNDLYIILTSFIDKEKTEDLIDKALLSNPSNEYLNFAILSYFENNSVDIFKEETVHITSKNINEKFKIGGFRIKKLQLYDDELDTLKIKTQSKNINVTYYYQGKLDAVTKDDELLSITTTGKLVKGGTIYLVIDISKLPNRNGNINIALPNSLKLNTNFDSEDGLYLNKNSNEYFSLSITDRYKLDTFVVPLYVTMSGNYEIEPVIATINGKYYISNNLEIEIGS